MAAITTNDNIFRQYLLNIPTCIQLIAQTSEQSTDDELVRAKVRHLVCTLPQRPLDMDPVNLLKYRDDLVDQKVWLEKQWSLEHEGKQLEPSICAVGIDKNGHEGRVVFPLEDDKRLCKYFPRESGHILLLMKRGFRAKIEGHPLIRCFLCIRVCEKSHRY